METFQRLKPISKNALIRCVEQEYRGHNRKELVDIIRGKIFGGVLIGMEPGVYNFSQLKTKVVQVPVEEYSSYCCFAVKAAISALLGNDIEERFPSLEFTSTIRLDQAA